ncbi:MAG: PPE family protein [Mycobacterium sp.]|uniref:PPE family protein n=1 Tax=Mycobacterium sp. TaxID=1785 RepID=UPI003C3B3875
MVFPFAALPPEVNSAFMYTGAGSGPLLAASTAWSNLAAELSTTATSWDSIIGTLTEQWTGAGSTAAAAAAQPYVGWLTQTAAAAEQAAAQAQASAAAYEAAFAGVVPPALIAANRSLLATLVATNFLGINTPAIAATEAHYAEMWVQDAVTLTTYEAASTAAAVLQPLTPASPTTSPAAAATQSLAVTQAATATPAASSLQGVLSGLLAGDPSSIGTGLFNALPVTVQNLLNAADGFLGTPLIFNGIQQVGVTAAWFVGNTIPTAISLGHTLAAAAPAAVSGVSSVTPLAGAAAIGEGTLVNSVMGSGASGALGGSTALGGLSVPASWSSAAPATLASSTAPLEGSGWTAATDEAGGGPVSGMMPGMAAAGKGAGAMAGPRYGFKPIVMPKQVVV